jgi:uncharacterized membrane protein YkvA (DUF1232 family)
VITIINAADVVIRVMKLIDQLKQKTKQLKAKIIILSIAYTDSRTPLIAKLIIAVTIGYLLSPIDLIPDFIPVIGWLDDLVVVPLLITLSIRLIPQPVIVEAEKKAGSSNKNFQRNNWLFAFIIISIWIAIVMYLIKFLPISLIKQ